MRRKISALVVSAFVACFTLLNFACSHPEIIDSEDDSVNFDFNDPKIKDRLGEDDGYTFAIMYGGDIHGSLETCG